MNRILVASCNSQYYKPVLWESMSERNAAAFIWAGDAIYGDTFTRTNLSIIERVLGTRKVQEATPQDLQKAYDIILNSTGYCELLTRQKREHRNKESSSFEHNMTVLGVWDDHDYGVDNGDTTYQHKIESAKLYMDFIKRSNSYTANFTIMEQRAASGKGLYGVKVFDFSRIDNFLLSDEDAGLEPATNSRSTPISLSNRSVAVFLLDVRSHRDPWPDNKGKIMGWNFEPDYDGDFLGDEQWQWLESVLKQSTATVNLIVQGLQVHPDRYFDGNTVEAWGRYPKAQHRLYQLILKSHVSVPVLVGGDVHKAELLRKDCRKIPNVLSTGSFDYSRMLLELTTSGMTHSWGSNVCSRPDDKIVCRARPLQLVLSNMMHYAHNNHLWTEVVHLKGRLSNSMAISAAADASVGSKTDSNGQVEDGAKSGYQYTLDRNFAEFEFDWDSRRIMIRVHGENTNDKPLLSTSWNFDLLNGTIALENQILHNADYMYRYHILSAKGIITDDDWICLNYQGELSLPAKIFSVLSPGTLASIVVLLPVIFVFRTLWSMFRRILRIRSSITTKPKQL
jgi:alkaline phosphatase D